jgi:hypothetical protein
MLCNILFGLLFIGRRILIAPCCRLKQFRRCEAVQSVKLA